MSLEKIIKYTFKNKKLLNQAFTHSSICGNNSRIESNQRLEFLGDALIGLIVTEYLYKLHPNLNEGTLTKMCGQVVSKKTLAKIAQKLNLDTYLKISNGAKKMHDHIKDSTLCDTLEALTAAIYLDSGFEQTKAIIKPLLKPYIKSSKQWQKGDPKSFLQEYTQKKYQQLPEYKIKHVSGEVHKPTFIVELYIQKKLKAIGKGDSKKKAQINAAKKFLSSINRQN